jgi:hypothetical protein
MRSREEIEKDGTRVDILTKELLLDIRELLSKQNKKLNKRKTPSIRKK